MKLFSFKKKKPTNLTARESKKQQKAVEIEERREVARHDEKEVDQRDREIKSIPAPKTFGSASRVILRPRITEKGTDLAAENNAYAFEVDPRSTKQQVAEGVRELYGVTPAQVRMITIPKKRTRSRRGQVGITGGGKKAYVYLKKGDSIEFV